VAGYCANGNENWVTDNIGISSLSVELTAAKEEILLQ
jgi:hypothetical protein